MRCESSEIDGPRVGFQSVEDAGREAGGKVEGEEGRGALAVGVSLGLLWKDGAYGRAGRGEYDVEIRVMRVGGSARRE